MYVSSPKSESSPIAEIEPEPPESRFKDICHFLDRQCHDAMTTVGEGMWTGVDIPPIDISELPYLLASHGRPYEGPFLDYCKKVITKPKYRRFGDGHEPFMMRLKIVSGQGEDDSITILLQREYIGYDISLQDGQLILQRTGRSTQILEGDKATEILEDIDYVALQLILLATYQSNQVSSKIEVCDSQALSATSEASVTKLKPSFGKRALQLLKI